MSSGFLLNRHFMKNYTYSFTFTRIFMEKLSCMTAKLTLSVDEEKIKKIKRISKRRGRSVSKLFEDFIDEVENKEIRQGLDINKIMGAFGKVPKNFDADKVKWEYLKEKHGL